jgi:hypothetical protein
MSVPSRSAARIAGSDRVDAKAKTGAEETSAESGGVRRSRGVAAARRETSATARERKSTKKSPGAETGRLDPLYVIFEQHLLNFEDSGSDRKSFIAAILADYLSHLRKLKVVVPKSLEQPVIEELASQVNTMLVKKIYGCLSIDDYRDKATSTARKRARDRYRRIART